MKSEFTAIIEQECRQNLAEAIALIFEDRREDALRGVPQNAIRETVLVGA